RRRRQARLRRRRRRRIAQAARAAGGRRSAIAARFLKEETVASRLTGVFPIAPTPFRDDGALDLDGQRRVLDCMVDQRADAICILANYSEQFLLSDSERDLLVDVCLSHVAGRVPVIVTCSHFSTRIVIERARAAARAGASMLMLMPPYHGTSLRADDQRVVEHYARIAEAVDLPIMVQDA